VIRYYSFFLYDMSCPASRLTYNFGQYTATIYNKALKNRE
jgi:hypothetical protein